jgi:hypothetical protein
MSRDAAEHGLTCCSARPMTADCGPAWPSTCHCWLPVWLPGGSPSSQVFESWNVAPNPDPLLPALPLTSPCSNQRRLLPKGAAAAYSHPRYSGDWP